MNHVEGRNVFPAVVNPFLRPTFEPAAPLPAAIVPVPEAMEPAEGEDAVVDAIEVKVVWGKDVVHVAHVSLGGAFTIGDAACQFALPAEVVGASRLPLVNGHGGSLRVVLPRAAAGTLQRKGEAPTAIADLVASGEALPSKEYEGAYELSLGGGSTARIELASANVVFELAQVRVGKRPAVGLLAGLRSESHLSTGVSAVLHGLLIASFAFFLPAMKATDGESIDRDQIDAMKPYLNAMAERELDHQDEIANTQPDKEPSGGTGSAAKDEAGSLGSASAPVRDARYAIKGNADNTDVHIARERALAEAETFGMLSILSGSPENAPIAAWARPDAVGKDAKSANGGLWGASIDDAFGAGGLTLSGIGEGGGGRNEGIGLGEIGGLGHGLGDGPGNGIGHGPGGPGGIGRGHDVLPGNYVPKGISMRVGDPKVNGRIPAEVIQRIVRQNFGRFRLCYEDALRSNPALSGRVAVKFTIDRSGAVGMAADGGSDMPDQKVVSCVVRGFQNLTFPEPQGGMVTVTYPLVFSPGE
jgi:hypothetical protein